MMSNLGLQNPVVFYLHGDYEYYYGLAEKHEKAIDLFIPVAQNIERELKKLLVNRVDDIAYLRFPVPDIPFLKNQTTGNIIFIGRLEPEKGYALLPVIAKTIKEKNINLQWHIVGADKAQLNNNTKWDENTQVKFYGNISNKEVIKLLAGMQILILPSLQEGMPLVLIEAMKSGVIPIVNDIDGGIQELIFDNETGYKIKDNRVNDYVEKICRITEDKIMAVQMQNNCITLANKLFDPVKNEKAFENKLEELSVAARKKKYSCKVYGSRLDNPWIPNSAVQVIRKNNI
jgi:glycosyltransferase involved in cell wall biosynthesis